MPRKATCAFDCTANAPSSHVPAGHNCVHTGHGGHAFNLVVTRHGGRVFQVALPELVVGIMGVGSGTVTRHGGRVFQVAVVGVGLPGVRCKVQELQTLSLPGIRFRV